MSAQAIAIPDTVAAGDAGRALELPDNVAAERLFVGRAPTTWSRAEQIAARLGEQIVDEEIKPGQRLREEAIAQAFGVSRGPVRDALQILHGAGLVSVSSRKGTFVTPLTEEDLREILELREALIALAFRRFAGTATPGDVALARLHLDAAQAIVADDGKRLVCLEALDRLVLAIAHRAGNGRLARQLTLLSLQAVRYLRRGVNTVTSRRELFAFHRDYLAAVENGQDVERLLAELHKLVRTRISIVTSAL